MSGLYDDDTLQWSKHQADLLHRLAVLLARCCCTKRWPTTDHAPPWPARAVPCEENGDD
jgi:hypothetical protein